MNRLELALKVRQKCGISGSQNTTINPTGEWKDVVDAVNEAYEYVQNEHTDWLFLRKLATFNTVAARAEYPVDDALLSLTDFGSWINDKFRVYNSATEAGRPLSFWTDYDHFIEVFPTTTQSVNLGAPTDITIAPDKSLILSATPIDASYIISGHYYSIPDVMTLDTDIPIFPARFHMMIAWRAIRMLAVGEAAVELIDIGREEYDSLLSKLETDQLPPITTDRGFL